MCQKKMEINNFDTDMYQRSPQIVLGFHGCDRSVAEAVLNSQTEHIEHSANNYDWLGTGAYFWLNDPLRAYEWACLTQKRKPEEIKEPYVIGAIIDLGLCLNFCERQAIALLQKSYDDLKNALQVTGLNITDKYKNLYPDAGGFTLKRPLDCAVINHIHDMLKEKNISYDTVYGYFQEGVDAYEGAGVKEKSHIQICVRNPNCIKGYFLPRIVQKTK